MNTQEMLAAVVAIVAATIFLSHTVSGMAGCHVEHARAMACSRAPEACEAIMGGQP